jgi:hypothetical protein
LTAWSILTEPVFIRSPLRGSKSRKKSKRTRSPSLSSEDSSEEERRRRDKKEKKRARKEKERERERRHHSSRRSRSRKREHNDESDDERKGRKRSNSRSKSETKDLRHQISKSPSRSPLPSEDDDEWVEKPSVAIADAVTSGPTHGAGERIPMISHGDDSDDSDDFGPQPIQKIIASKKIDERSFGGALLRGEGSAMAAFLQDGTDSRIPRRGEIGLTSDEIASYESVGYVMSGSRHRRMNAVRMRKENQVISAEEKRGILKLQREERERREAILREEFGELVSESLKGAEGKPK